MSVIDIAMAAGRLWQELPAADVSLYLGDDMVYHVGISGKQVELTIDEGERQVLNDFFDVDHARMFAGLLLGAADAIAKADTDQIQAQNSLETDSEQERNGK